MSTVDDILADVREQIDADGAPLKEARIRLNLVLKQAEKLPGRLRTYRSGSLAAHTMIDPVTDGDGGLVLDRRHHHTLGRDGDSEAPTRVVAELIEFLGDEVRKKYPAARIHKSKRGPEIHFRRPVNGVDPTADLIVALTHKDEVGLWIPNLETDRWARSHPEKHTELLEAGNKQLRSKRRKVIRLAKAWNKQFYEPAVSSFQLSVWALEFVE